MFKFKKKNKKEEVATMTFEEFKQAYAGLSEEDKKAFSASLTDMEEKTEPPQVEPREEGTPGTEEPAPQPEEKTEEPAPQAEPPKEKNAAGATELTDIVKRLEKAEGLLTKLLQRSQPVEKDTEDKLEQMKNKFIN